jgi:hypothetical protein
MKMFFVVMILVTLLGIAALGDGSNPAMAVLSVCLMIVMLWLLIRTVT